MSITFVLELWCINKNTLSIAKFISNIHTELCAGWGFEELKSRAFIIYKPKKTNRVPKQWPIPSGIHRLYPRVWTLGTRQVAFGERHFDPQSAPKIFYRILMTNIKFLCAICAMANPVSRETIFSLENIEFCVLTCKILKFSRLRSNLTLYTV